MRRRIVFWLRKQISSRKAKGVVLGLSGGLDSCVAAALAIQALGTKKVLALVLPCHSHKKDYQHAMLFARKFGIRTRVIDLTRIYDALVKILPAADKLAVANIRPRLRMVVLYYFARKLGYLVCGTSNKSEIMSGYFTKYGDGASDILPIGGIYKTQVRKLAQELDIPAPIIEKPPTAGLWRDQTDEKDLGVTYSELDDILMRMERRQKQRLPKAKIARVRYLVVSSCHKRDRAAVCAL
jgi:NAD+ synthase